MSADEFHGHLWNRSARFPHTPVSGRGRGMEEEEEVGHPSINLKVGRDAEPRWMAADAAESGGQR